MFDISEEVKLFMVKNPLYAGKSLNSIITAKLVIEAKFPNGYSGEVLDNFHIISEDEISERLNDSKKMMNAQYMEGRDSDYKTKVSDDTTAEIIKKVVDSMGNKIMDDIKLFMERNPEFKGDKFADIMAVRTIIEDRTIFENGYNGEVVSLVKDDVNMSKFVETIMSDIGVDTSTTIYEDVRTSLSKVLDNQVSMEILGMDIPSEFIYDSTSSNSKRYVVSEYRNDTPIMDKIEVSSKYGKFGGAIVGNPDKVNLREMDIDGDIDMGGIVDYDFDNPYDSKRVTPFPSVGKTIRDGRVSTNVEDRILADKLSEMYGIDNDKKPVVSEFLIDVKDSDGAIIKSNIPMSSVDAQSILTGHYRNYTRRRVSVDMDFVHDREEIILEIADAEVSSRDDKVCSIICDSRWVAKDVVEQIIQGAFIEPKVISQVDEMPSDGGNVEADKMDRLTIIAVNNDTNINDVLDIEVEECGFIIVVLFEPDMIQNRALLTYPIIVTDDGKASRIEM